MTNAAPTLATRCARRRHPFARCIAWMLLACCGLHADAFAAFRATLVSSDFSRQDVHVEAITPEGLRYRVGSGAPQTVPLTKVLWIERPPVRQVNGPALNESRFEIELRDGQRWPGRPINIDAQSLQWTSPLLGVRRVELKDVKAVNRQGEVVGQLNGSTTHDAIYLTNGDVLSGVISGGDAGGVDCQPADGPAVRVAWENVRSLRLAAAGEPTPATQPIRVELRDGTVASGNTLLIDESSFKLDGSAAVPLDALSAVENRSSEVRLLALVPPTSSTYAPFFPRTQPVEGAPDASHVVDVAGLSSRSTLLARPRSLLAWNLDGTHSRFRTRFAVADGRGLADVTVRVLLDDKVAFEQKNVRSGTLSDVVDIPLDGARVLKLEVDFGENYDVQDELYWIEPALLAR
jgi:NPCBM/NEW2 domain